MIRAVFFDFYGTLVRFDPPGESIQSLILQDFGLYASEETLRQAYRKADDYMARENGRDPVFGRSLPHRNAFFTRYEHILLQAAGVEVDQEIAFQIWQKVNETPRGLALYEDVIPTLSGLKTRGLILGVITNLNGDLKKLLEDLDILQWIDVWVTSMEVGHNKPDPAVFRAALTKAKVPPREAFHVGDQYHSDVEGARSAGIHAVLLERTSHTILDGKKRPETIQTLTEVLDLIKRTHVNW
jgi:putative hydrolase of the HAD superfamily